MKTRHLLLSVLALGLVTAASALNLGGLSKGLDVLNKAKEGKAVVDDLNKVVSTIGPEEERALGETVALEIIGKFGGLVRDEEPMRRINLVGHALVRYSARPDHAWRFGILNSDTVNAFSAPDGYVLITRGLYETANDDDKLAAILGHEIAHITGRDALRIIETGQKSAIITKNVAQRSSDVRAVDSVLSQAGLNTEKIVKYLFEKGYDHPTEFGADKNGRALAMTTGYAPDGLRTVLQDLQGRKSESKKIFATHPPLADRIKRLPVD